MRPIGWRYESARHSLAARGISTWRSYAVRMHKYGRIGPSYIGVEEGLRRDKKMDVFEQGSRLAPRNAVEKYLMDTSKTSLAGAMRVLKYRDRARDLRAEHASDPYLSAYEQLVSLRKAYDEIDPSVHLGTTRRRDLKKRMAVQEKFLASLRISPARFIFDPKKGKRVSEYEKYSTDAKVAMYNLTMRKEALGVAEEKAEREQAVTAMKEEPEFEKKEEWREFLPARPGEEEIFSLIDRNVAMRVLTPAQGVELKKQIAVTTWPKGVKAAEPYYAQVDRDVAAGILTIPEAMKRRQEYTDAIKRLGQEKLKRLQFSPAVGLPQTPAVTIFEKPKIEWFARKRKPWLIM